MVNEVDYPGSNPGPIIFHLSLVLNIIAYDKNVSKENKIFALEGKKNNQKVMNEKDPCFKETPSMMVGINCLDKVQPIMI